MFDGLDFSKMGDVLADLQKKAQELQTQTENQEFSVKSGGGMVQIKLNGKGEVLDVLIDESFCTLCEIALNGLETPLKYSRFSAKITEISKSAKVA